MRVAIVGSRDCQGFTAERMLAAIPKQCSLILSGGAAGADAFAAQCARLLGVPLREFLPEYEKYGRNAPHMRNIEIVRAADLVLAFWNFSSRGTADVLAECVRQGVLFQIIGPDA